MSTIAKTSVRTYQNYVSGQWVSSASGETFPVYDPSTEEVIAQVPSSNAADIDNAAKALGNSPSLNAATPASPLSKRNMTSPTWQPVSSITVASPTKSLAA